ncbi:MAG TPA: hypothetical protein VIR59_00540 [Gaiellaceae bacterium]
MGRAERWIFAPESARRLAGVRIGLCLLLAYRLTARDYDAFAARHVRFVPHFYMDVFAHMPSPALASELQALGIASALLAALGVALRITLPVAFSCALILDGILNSAGRVLVRDALLMLCVILIIAAGRAAGDAWAVRAPHRTTAGPRYGWPIRTAMLVIALAYFFAAFQKWRYSGFAWVTSDNLRWILYAQPHPSGLALFVADRPVLAHLLAGGTLLLETCFPLILFVPALRWLFIPAVVAMHISIQIALRLDYSAQWLTVVIVFVDWPRVVDWARRTLAPVTAPREVAR